MITGDKILETMYTLMHQLESDWTEQLEQLNIYDDVETIYKAPGIDGDTLRGNIVICYTVLAYSNKSTFLEPHKSRWDNKKKILVKLAGLSTMTIGFFKDLLDNKHAESFNLATWYLEYQKNWRWSQYVTLTEYHSMAESMSKRGAADAQEAVQIGKMLEIAEGRRRRADEILDELKTEYLALDTALEKEGRPIITDMENNNFMSYENYLDNKNKAAAAGGSL